MAQGPSNTWFNFVVTFLFREYIVNKMAGTQEQLLSLLAGRLFNVPTDVAINDALLQEARLQAVESLISKDLHSIANNMRVIYAHTKLSDTLAEIPFTTIKGYASAYYYSQPILRTMGDVDLYVDADHYDDAIRRFEHSGYRPVDESHERHDTFSKDEVLFELHSEIKGIPNGKDGIKVASDTMESKVRNYLADLIPTARTVETSYGSICIPDDFHHGLIMLLHVAGHMINDGGIGLRHLCDWAVYVDRVDVEKYKTQLQDMGLWTFACQLTAVCSRYLGFRAMPWAGTWDDVFLNQLITDILNAGNFGRKEDGRSTGLALNNEGNLVSSFAEMTMHRYNFCKEKPIFLPIGMVMNSMRYLRLVALGKKKLVSPEMISAGAERKALYKQFHLFEN